MTASLNAAQLADLISARQVSVPAWVLPARYRDKIGKFAHHRRVDFPRSYVLPGVTSGRPLSPDSQRKHLEGWANGLIAEWAYPLAPANLILGDGVSARVDRHADATSVTFTWYTDGAELPEQTERDNIKRRAVIDAAAERLNQRIAETAEAAARPSRVRGTLVRRGDGA